MIEVPMATNINSKKSADDIAEVERTDDYY